MTVDDALARIQVIQIHQGAASVVIVAAERMAAASGADIVRTSIDVEVRTAGVFQISFPERNGVAGSTPALFLRLSEDGAGFLTATSSSLLYGGVVNLLKRLGDEAVKKYRDGRRMDVAFCLLYTSDAADE